jgi:hypothetical protein
MDEADKAEHQEELARQVAISRRKPVPKRHGLCLNCGKKSPGAYCDSECRDDAERFERARQRDGSR